MRRLLRSTAAAAVCAGAVALAAGSFAAPASPQPSVATLVAQLGAEQFADREAAGRALEKLGSAALPALQAAARSDNAEVRARATQLLAKLRRTTESTSRLAAKRVKLDYRDIPLGTAINDLRARTGLPIVLDGNRVANPLRKVTCVTEELPIWEAVERFCRAAELRELFTTDLDVPKSSNRRRGEFVPPPDPRADAVAIVLMDGTPDRLSGERSTAVRVTALPPSFPGHRVSLGSGEYTFCLDVTPAPGLNWQELVGVKVSRVIDSSGRAGSGGVEKPAPAGVDPTHGGTVVFARPGVVMRFDVNGNPIMPETIPNPRIVPVPLTVATPTAKSLKRLEGVAYGEVNLLNQHLVTITDLKTNTGRAIEGPDELKVTLLDVREAERGGQGLVRVQFEYPSPWVAMARKKRFNFAMGWPELPQPQSMTRSLQAFDAEGKPFPVTTSGHTDFTDDGQINIQTMQFTFRGESGLPAKLVVVGPRSVFVEVPFVLENVQLP
jgi:hypothetical protein